MSKVISCVLGAMIIVGLSLALLTGCSQDMWKGKITSRCDGIEVTYRIMGNGRVFVDSVIDHTRNLTCTINYSQGPCVFCFPMLGEGE